MRPLSTTAWVMITAVLAALLLAYVFMGGGGRGQPQDDIRCASRQSFDQLKRDLFRQASMLRGAAQPALPEVANYSVVRASSKIVRRYDDRSKVVTCAGPIALDLPPGVAVIGGRRTLSANIRYAFEAEGARRGQLRYVINSGSILVPLATIAPAGAQATLPGPAAPAAAAPGAAASELADATSGVPTNAPTSPAVRAKAAPQAKPSAKTATPPPASQRARSSVRASPEQAGPNRRGETPGTPAPRRTVMVTAQGSRPPSPAPPRVSVSPSFNCRYARTRGEVAVCSDTSLAALDRQMAARFYRAVGAADRAQRRVLERSRTRFLRYRDSCGSAACMAQAYRARMQEIDEIMARRWRP